MSRWRNVGLAVVLALAVSMPASGASRSRTPTVTVTAAAIAKLSISASGISFQNADPDLVPLVPATGGALLITAKGRTSAGGTISLTVLASDDLRYGTLTIPASKVTWTVTGAGFTAGTMDRTLARTVASWISSGERSGTQSYFLENAWTYPTGTYSATFSYTLTAP